MRKIFILSCIFIFSLSSYAFCADSKDNLNEEKWSFPFSKEVGVISGYAHGNLEVKGSYKVIPFIVRLGFNLDTIGFGFSDLILPLATKLGMNPKGFTEFIVEPYINTVVSPRTNIEAGCGILLKYSYPLTTKLYPYALGGLGMAYLSQHTRTQSTHWGFTPQLGLGLMYFFKKDIALDFEYRYRHFSNAGIKKPNNGINVNMFLIGLSKFF